MIDISVRREDSKKAIVYLDGKDARLFKYLATKLGSEERVQNAIILEGLMQKSRNASSKDRILQIEKLYPDLVGVSHSELLRILSAL